MPRRRQIPLDDFDPDVALANDESVEQLPPPPVIDGRGSPRSDLFGESAIPAVGRPTSPKLYAHAATQDACVQLRVIKIENGAPVGLGAIDKDATEDDLIRMFFAAMPTAAEGKAVFKLRPLDINSNELGHEVTLLLSSNHATVRRLREESAANPSGVPGVTVLQPAAPGLPPELVRLYEKQIELAEKRAELLESRLQQEVERIRAEEEQRTKERIDLATNAALGVKELMSSTMEEERRRAELALKFQADRDEQMRRMQAEQSQFVVAQVQGTSQQQLTQLQAWIEQQRRSDEYRLEQERLKAERERQEAEDRRRRERDEADERRRREIAEYDQRMQRERAELAVRLEQERKDLEAKLLREKEERESKERMAREEREARERREKDEREARENREREERERRERNEREMFEARERERERQHTRMLEEAKLSAQMQREHAERMMQLSQKELSAQNGMNVVELLPKAATFIETNLGMKPVDLIARLVGGGGDGGSAWADALPKLAGVAGDVIQAMVKARQGGGPPALPSNPFVPPALLGQAARKRGVPVETDDGEDVEEADEAGEGGAEAPAQPAQPAASPLAKEATDAGLSLAAQKNARNAIRDLVRKLRVSPEATWLEHIAMAYAAEGSIYHYAKAVGLARALGEAGAPPEMATKILDLARGSGVIPPEILEQA